MSDRGDHHLVSDYALARHHAGELTPDERAELDAHLAGCERCRQRLAAIPGRRAEALRVLPVASLLASARARKERSRRSWLMSPRLLVGLAAAACLLLAFVAVLRHGGEGPVDHRGGGIRLKGAFDVEWVVARDGAQLRAGQGFAFRAGDRIGLRVRAPRPVVAQVFAVDRRGRVELLIPAPGGAAPRIPAGSATVLPTSLELEPPLAPRRVFVVLGERARSRSELDLAVKRALSGGAGVGALRRLALGGAWIHLDSRWIEGDTR